MSFFCASSVQHACVGACTVCAHAGEPDSAVVLKSCNLGDDLPGEKPLPAIGLDFFHFVHAYLNYTTLPVSAASHPTKSATESRCLWTPCLLSLLEAASAMSLMRSEANSDPRRGGRLSFHSPNGVCSDAGGTALRFAFILSFKPPTVFFFGSAHAISCPCNIR